MATIKMPDNQSFELDDEIAGDDVQLRAALSAAYPDAANATFERSGGKDSKPLVVKVVKKAGTKGLHAAISELLAAPEYQNPAVAMQCRIAERGSLSHLEMLALKPEIENAIKTAEADLRLAGDAERVLATAPAATSGAIPLGF
ncbi:MAG: hypothetical protein JNK38_01070 [Acidobacteria bacterium]|nr:hypothetical protein [Acidobacteriota bacterium]